MCRSYGKRRARLQHPAATGRAACPKCGETDALEEIKAKMENPGGGCLGDVGSAVKAHKSTIVQAAAK